MSMNRFTVEETNLLSIYHEGSKAQLTENINAALPYMDADMRELAKRALSKVDALTEEEFAELMDSGELEYIQNGNRRLIADAAIWDWYHRAKTTAKPPARQGG